MIFDYRQTQVFIHNLKVNYFNASLREHDYDHSELNRLNQVLFLRLCLVTRHNIFITYFSGPL